MWPTHGRRHHRAALGRAVLGVPQADQVFRGQRRTLEAGLRKVRTQASLLMSQESGELKAILGLGQGLRPPWPSRPVLSRRRRGWPLMVETGQTKDST